MSLPYCVSLCCRITPPMAPPGRCHGNLNIAMPPLTPTHVTETDIGILGWVLISKKQSPSFAQALLTRFFVGVSCPSNIYGHVRVGIDLW